MSLRIHLAIAALAVSGTFAVAQTVTPPITKQAPAAETTAPVVTQPQPSTATTKSPAPAAGTLVPGANSFTEAQAKERIMKAGYTSVVGLKKDDQGIWHGTGTKNGKTNTVGLDFKGNIVEMKQ